MICDWIFDNLGKLLLAIFVAIFACIGWAIYDEVHAEKFYLRKDKWACTASHGETMVTYVSYDGGKTSMPVYSETTVCDQWSHR